MSDHVFKVGDVVEYIACQRQFESRNGSIGIITAGPHPELNKEISYSVSWIISMHPWDNPELHEFRSYLLKHFRGKLNVQLDQNPPPVSTASPASGKLKSSARGNQSRPSGRRGSSR